MFVRKYKRCLIKTIEEEKRERHTCIIYINNRDNHLLRALVWPLKRLTRRQKNSRCVFLVWVFIINYKTFISLLDRMPFHHPFILLLLLSLLVALTLTIPPPTTAVININNANDLSQRLNSDLLSNKPNLFPEEDQQLDTDDDDTHKTSSPTRRRQRRRTSPNNKPKPEYINPTDLRLLTNNANTDDDTTSTTTITTTRSLATSGDDSSVVVTPLTFNFTLDAGRLYEYPNISSQFFVYNLRCAPAGSSIDASITYTVTGCANNPYWLNVSEVVGNTRNPGLGITKKIDPERGLPDTFEFSIDFTQISIRNPPNFDNQSIPLGACLIVNYVWNDGTSSKSGAQTITIGAQPREKCPPGRKSPTGDNTAVCELCDIATYSEEPGQSSCITCPETLPTTITKGATSKSFCTAKGGEGTNGFYVQGNSSKPCKVGANCTQSGLTLKTLPLKATYWRTCDESEVFWLCPLPEYCAGGLAPPCPKNVSDETTRRRMLDDLDDGRMCIHNHRGVFCQTCAPGSVPRGSSRRCETCSEDNILQDNTKLIFLVIGLGIVLFLALVFSVWRLRKVISRMKAKVLGDKDKVTFFVRVQRVMKTLNIQTMFKILVGYFQVVSAMAVVFNDQLPPFFDDISKILNFATFDFLSSLDLGCSAPVQNFAVQLYVSTILPALFCLFIFVMHTLAQLFMYTFNKPRQMKNEARQIAMTVFLTTTFIVYPSIASKTLMMLQPCETLDTGKKVLKADATIDCASLEYLAAYIYAVAMVIIYIIGIPVIYSFLLFINRGRLNPKMDGDEAMLQDIRDQDKGIQHLAFLYSTYRIHAYWFEVAELLRKLFQTGVLVFAAPGTSLQIVFQLVITIVMVALLNYFRPYRLTENGILAVGAQWAIFGLSFICLLIKLDDAACTRGTSGYDPNVLDSILVATFLVVPGMMAFFLLRAFTKLIISFRKTKDDTVADRKRRRKKKKQRGEALDEEEQLEENEEQLDEAMQEARLLDAKEELERVEAINKLLEMERNLKLDAFGKEAKALVRDILSKTAETRESFDSRVAQTQVAIKHTINNTKILQSAIQGLQAQLTELMEKDEARFAERDRVKQIWLESEAKVDEALEKANQAKTERAKRPSFGEFGLKNPLANAGGSIRNFFGGKG
jgi:hypothetical protein